MLDVKRFRTDFEGIKKSLAKRNKEYNLDGFLELDNKRRSLLGEVEELKNKQNVASKQIPALK